MRDYQLAFPRGYGENNISAEDNAKKELREEIGATGITKIKRIGEVVANSGISGDKAQVYVCDVANYKKDSHKEGIDTILEITLDRFEQMIKKGEINDGYTLSAWALINSRQYSIG
jgi:ADP-ribose pyrophosphatase